MAFSSRDKDLVRLGDKLFSDRLRLHSLWQTTAENFYPERADFTRQWLLGDEYASNLMTGRPVLARRDLANQLSSMLRPRGRPWFYPRTNDDRVNDDPTARRWLDMAGDRMRRIMYEKSAQFIRSTKEGDNDFAAFGQCVISVDLNSQRDGLLYRTWHLRDVAWCENSMLVIDAVHRNWSLAAVEVKKLFSKTFAPELNQIIEKDPYKPVKCRHVVVPYDSYYDGATKPKGRKLPFVSLYFDLDNDVVLDETPVKRIPYVIPRWQTISGSQYAHSPATVIALPDARLLQQITLTLLEAGQKAVDPPLVGVDSVINGAVNSYAGGVTWVDEEYDERTGEALRPLGLKYDHIQFGVDREERIQKLIEEAFYLNLIQMPDISGPEKTAYQVQKEVEEYIRRALPLFEPMEVEYNGGLCEITFQYMMENGAFGDPSQIPQVLLGQDINWQFESPLQSANERAKSQAFIDSANLLNTAVAIDPNARFKLDVNKAFGDALQGVGAPADWIVDDKVAAAMAQNAAKQQQIAAFANQVNQGAQVATNVAMASRHIMAANKESQAEQANA